MAEQLALADLQRWMVGALCRPDDTAGVDVAEVVAGSDARGAGWRLDLYRHGYRARLVECLRAMHPALRHALGDSVFDAFALDYIESWPSRSYTLFRLGKSFARHLAQTRPDDASWSDFVIDVVRFEQAFLRVYDGEGPEGHPTVSAGGARDLAADGRGWVVTGAPGLWLFHSRYPVGEYVLAVRRGDHPELPAPRPTWAALVRRDYVVTLVPLDECRFAVLEALIAGSTVWGVARAHGTAPDQVRAWLGEWVERGLIRPSTTEKESR
jgi:hypothetical protein